jgi:hypothetical protein
MKITNVDLLLSIQRALLGNISPNLRAVCTKLEEKAINIYFYYDKKISDENCELSAHTIDQVMADFWENEDGNEIEFYTPILLLNYPQKMPLVGDWVYYRHED